MSTTPALSFDFIPILASLDPHHTYTPTPLAGGLVNLTSRITIAPKPDSEQHECLFRQASGSVVAKYAPPYVAAVGESAPFSQFRQVIEARALHLLSHPSTRAYIHNGVSHNVSTPSLIHHDPNAYVLLMSDLGHDSLTLDRWLTSVCPSVEAATAVDLQLDFTNPGARELVLDVAVRAVNDNLLKCGIDPAEAAALTQAAVDMFVRQGEWDANVFSLGDCWPKSLLILAGDGLAVIDWEFAGMDAPLQDVGQLAAHLYLLYQTSSSASQPAIQAFAFAFYRTHRIQAPDWWYEASHRADAWRLFGREVVNNVVEVDWFDGDEVKKRGRDEHARKERRRIYEGRKTEGE
ncbi:hypothetical protein FRC12_016340 [Ceratobasidium sp. 428]|nr:hypothetical protein FRC12_016340 [Ceratobasidium sp. 428]